MAVAEKETMKDPMSLQKLGQGLCEPKTSPVSTPSGVSGAVTFQAGTPSL